MGNNRKLVTDEETRKKFLKCDQEISSVMSKNGMDIREGCSLLASIIIDMIQTHSTNKVHDCLAFANWFEEIAEKEGEK